MLIANIMLAVHNAVCIMLFVNKLQIAKMKTTVHIFLTVHIMLTMHTMLIILF